MLCSTNLNNILSLILLMLKLKTTFLANNNNRLHKEKKREERGEGSVAHVNLPTSNIWRFFYIVLVI